MQAVLGEGQQRVLSADLGDAQGSRTVVGNLSIMASPTQSQVSYTIVCAIRLGNCFTATDRLAMYDDCLLHRVLELFRPMQCKG